MSTPLRREREVDALAYQAEVEDGIDVAERAGVDVDDEALGYAQGVSTERQRILALITEQEAGLTDLDKLIVLTDLRDRIGEEDGRAMA